MRNARESGSYQLPRLFTAQPVASTLFETSSNVKRSTSQLNPPQQLATVVLPSVRRRDKESDARPSQLDREHDAFAIIHQDLREQQDKQPHSNMQIGSHSSHPPSTSTERLRDAEAALDSLLTHRISQRIVSEASAHVPSPHSPPTTSHDSTKIAHPLDKFTLLQELIERFQLQFVPLPTDLHSDELLHQATTPLPMELPPSIGILKAALRSSTMLVNDNKDGDGDEGTGQVSNSLFDVQPLVTWLKDTEACIAQRGVPRSFTTAAYHAAMTTAITHGVPLRNSVAASHLTLPSALGSTSALPSAGCTQEKTLGPTFDKHTPPYEVLINAARSTRSHEASPFLLDNESHRNAWYRAITAEKACYLAMLEVLLALRSIPATASISELLETVWLRYTKALRARETQRVKQYLIAFQQQFDAKVADLKTAFQTTKDALLQSTLSAHNDRKAALAAQFASEACTRDLGHALHETTTRLVRARGKLAVVNDRTNDTIAAIKIQLQQTQEKVSALSCQVTTLQDQVKTLEDARMSAVNRLITWRRAISSFLSTETLHPAIRIATEKASERTSVYGERTQEDALLKGGVGFRGTEETATSQHNYKLCPASKQLAPTQNLLSPPLLSNIQDELKRVDPQSLGRLITDLHELLRSQWVEDVAHGTIGVAVQSVGSQTPEEWVNASSQSKNLATMAPSTHAPPMLVHRRQYQPQISELVPPLSPPALFDVGHGLKAKMADSSDSLEYPSEALSAKGSPMLGSKPQPSTRVPFARPAHMVVFNRPSTQQWKNNSASADKLSSSLPTSSKLASVKILAPTDAATLIQAAFRGHRTRALLRASRGQILDHSEHGQGQEQKSDQSEHLGPYYRPTTSDVLTVLDGDRLKSGLRSVSADGIPGQSYHPDQRLQITETPCGAVNMLSSTAHRQARLEMTKILLSRAEHSSSQKLHPDILSTILSPQISPPSTQQHILGCQTISVNNINDDLPAQPLHLKGLYVELPTALTWTLPSKVNDPQSHESQPHSSSNKLPGTKAHNQSKSLAVKSHPLVKTASSPTALNTASAHGIALSPFFSLPYLPPSCTSFINTADVSRLALARMHFPRLMDASRLSMFTNRLINFAVDRLDSISPGLLPSARYFATPLLPPTQLPSLAELIHDHYVEDLGSLEAADMAFIDLLLSFEQVLGNITTGSPQVSLPGCETTQTRSRLARNPHDASTSRLRLFYRILCETTPSPWIGHKSPATSSKTTISRGATPTFHKKVDSIGMPDPQSSYLHNAHHSALFTHALSTRLRTNVPMATIISIPTPHPIQQSNSLPTPSPSNLSKDQSHYRADQQILPLSRRLSVVYLALYRYFSLSCSLEGNLNRRLSGPIFVSKEAASSAVKALFAHCDGKLVDEVLMLVQRGGYVVPPCPSSTQSSDQTIGLPETAINVDGGNYHSVFNNALSRHIDKRHEWSIASSGKCLSGLVDLDVLMEVVIETYLALDGQVHLRIYNELLRLVVEQNGSSFVASATPPKKTPNNATTTLVAALRRQAERSLMSEPLTLPRVHALVMSLLPELDCLDNPTMERYTSTIYRLSRLGLAPDEHPHIHQFIEAVRSVTLPLLSPHAKTVRSSSTYGPGSTIMSSHTSSDSRVGDLGLPFAVPMGWCLDGQHSDKLSQPQASLSGRQTQDYTSDSINAGNKYQVNPEHDDDSISEIDTFLNTTGLGDEAIKQDLRRRLQDQEILWKRRLQAALEETRHQHERQQITLQSRITQLETKLTTLAEQAALGVEKAKLEAARDYNRAVAGNEMIVQGLNKQHEMLQEELETVLSRTSEELKTRVPQAQVEEERARLRTEYDAQINALRKELVEIRHTTDIKSANMERDMIALKLEKARLQMRLEDAVGRNRQLRHRLEDLNHQDSTLSSSNVPLIRPINNSSTAIPSRGQQAHGSRILRMGAISSPTFSHNTRTIGSSSHH